MSTSSPKAIEVQDSYMSEGRAERLDQNILYAQKLQDALFRNTDVSKLFTDSFIFDQPKDMVGGDFYLIDTVAGKKMVLVGDCTGHGPSGAMLSALCVSTLKELFRKYKNLSPSLIIKKALLKLEEMLKREDDFINDSMEVTLLFINEEKQEIKYASTGQNIYIYGVSADKVIKSPHVGLESSQLDQLKDQTLKYTPGDMIYLPTDGMKDQFGSETGKRFSTKKMAALFESIQQQSCDSQKANIREEFLRWRGELEDQTDDVLLIGLRL